MKLTPDQKAGLYITAIIHLAVIIVLLLCQIGYSVQRENSFVLDFTKQEEKEAEQKQEELHRSALAQLENLLAAARTQPVRSIAVNRSQLKDDRNTEHRPPFPQRRRKAAPRWFASRHPALEGAARRSDAQGDFRRIRAARARFEKQTVIVPCGDFSPSPPDEGRSALLY